MADTVLGRDSHLTSNEVGIFDIALSYVVLHGDFIPLVIRTSCVLVVTITIINIHGAFPVQEALRQALSLGYIVWSLNQPYQERTNVIPHFTDEQTEAERRSDLPKVTQLLLGTAGGGDPQAGPRASTFNL